MRQKTGPQTSAAEKTIKDIRRAARKHHSAEDKIRIVLEGLRGEDSIAAICRREGIAESLYYSWSKEFLEAGKKRLAGDTSRSATSDEVKALRNVFGADIGRVPVSSTKALTGHGLSMSTALETGFCALALRGGFTTGEVLRLDGGRSL